MREDGSHENRRARLHCLHAPACAVNDPIGPNMSPNNPLAYLYTDQMSLNGPLSTVPHRFGLVPSRKKTPHLQVHLFGTACAVERTRVKFYFYGYYAGQGHNITIQANLERPQTSNYSKLPISSSCPLPYPVPGPLVVGLSKFCSRKRSAC